MSGTLSMNHSFYCSCSKILSTSKSVIGSTTTLLSSVCYVLSKALPSIEWLNMSLFTLLVKIFYNCFLLQPWMNPGIAFFKLFQNRVCNNVSKPQYSELGLQIVLGLSETSIIRCCVNLLGSALQTSPPLMIVLKLPLATLELWHSLINYFMYASFLL